MATNRYTNLTPANFNPLSLQEQMMIPLAKQKQHDALLADATKSGMFDVNRLEVDDPLVTAEIDRLRGQFNNIEDELLDQGVSSGLKRRLLDVKRERDAFLSNSGIGGKANAAYKAYQDNVKNIRSNRNISPQDADAFINYAYKRYTDSGGVDADAVYNSYNGAATVAIGDKSRQIASQMKPQDITRILRQNGIVRNTKQLSPQDIEQAVMYSLMTDNNTMDYVNALSESTGQDKMSILRNAAKTSGLVYQRDDRHDRPLATRGRSAKRPSRAKTQRNSAGLVALEGDVITAKRRFGSMENLRGIALDANHPDNLYAKRVIDQMTSHVLNLPKNQAILEEVRKGMSELPEELKTSENLVEWARDSANRVVGKAKAQEIDGKYYITAIDGGTSNVDVFEVDEQVYNEFNNGVYGNIPHEVLSKQKQRGNVQGRTAVKNSTPIITKQVTDSIDEYFNKTGSPTTKYTFENLKNTDRKFITDNIFNLATSGGIDNFEVINLYSADEGGDVKFDEENTIKRKKEMFDILKSGNVTDKEVKHIYYDNYSGVPVVRISFMKNSPDGKTNKYHEMDIAVDKINNRTGVKSGEYALLNSLKQFGGKQGEVLHDYMTKSIKYKDVLENYDINDFDNSANIKRALPDRLFESKGLFKESDKLNIYNNNGNFHMIIKDEDENSRPLRWKDIVTSDKLSKMSPKSNPDFYKAIIKQAVDTGYVDKDLREVTVYDENGNGRFDGKKMDDIIRTMIDFNEMVTTKDKIVLMNILNSKK